MTRSTASRKLLDIPTTAGMIACSRGHVYRLIATGQLRSVDIKVKGSTRSKTRIPEEDVAAFIAANTTRATA